MTVADLEERMSNAEYVNWTMYYAKQAQQQELERKMAEARSR